jgi:hypothetical protein
MPTVHFIRRKWLEQRKFQACLHQAEKIRKTTAVPDNKSNGKKLLSLTCAAPSLSAYNNNNHHVPCENAPDQLLLTETPHERVAAPSKKRRLSPSHYHNIISPQTIASGDYNDDESVISETPVLHSRKRKMQRTCQKQQAVATDDRLLEISAAIGDNIIPRDTDCKCNTLLSFTIMLLQVPLISLSIYIFTHVSIVFISLICLCSQYLHSCLICTLSYMSWTRLLLLRPKQLPPRK